MTDTEKAHARQFGALFGLWNAATFFLPFFAVMFMPYPLGWWFGGLAFVTGLAFYPSWTRMQREFLASTAWARQQQITPEQIRRRNYTAREVSIGAITGAAIVCLIILTVMNWNRVLAADQASTAVWLSALIIGVVSVVAAWMKLRQRESAPATSKFRVHRSSVLLILTFVALVYLTFRLLSVLFMVNSVTANVYTQHPLVDGGNFSFRHEVECPAGWSIWLTVENVQLTGDGESRHAAGPPVIVSRWQAKLEGGYRVRVPLEYLPTSDEGQGKMLASVGPAEGYLVALEPNRGRSLLAYTTESLMRVWVTVMMLPDGQSPDAQAAALGTARFKTIEPPVRPKLAPFEAAYAQGRVELVVLGPHPSKDQPCWKPNGEPSAEGVMPEFGGRSTARGKVIREMVVRVHSETGSSSQPVLRYPAKSGISGMGNALYAPTDRQPYSVFIQSIACPPEARQMTVEVGVADGEWHSSLTFTRHENQLQFSASESGGTTGSWEGSVRTTQNTGDTVPLSFRYSWRDDYETRLVYEQADGTIVRLKEEGSDHGHGLINALTTLPVKEFETIRRFHVQSRPYQWVEFRNVSLELGHRTIVEVQSAN